MMAALLAAVPLLILDLTTGDGGLVSSGTPGQWMWGVVEAGPVDVPAAWGTALTDVYRNNESSTLQVELPDVKGAAKPMLVLEQWYDIAEGDSAVLEARDVGASGWVPLEPVFGYPGPDGFVGERRAWHEAVFALTPGAAVESVRLRLETDASDAADGWFLRGLELYDGDVMPPLITPLEVPTDTQDVSGPYEVVVRIEEDGFVEDATLWWSEGGEASPLRMAEAGDQWSAAIPAVAPGTVVSWYVEVSDGENLGRFPADGEEAFRVFLAAPGAPVRVDTQRVSQAVELRWEPPVSPHSVLGYLLWQEGASEAWAVESSEATFTLDPELPTAVFVVA